MSSEDLRATGADGLGGGFLREIKFCAGRVVDVVDDVIAGEVEEVVEEVACGVATDVPKVRGAALVTGVDSVLEAGAGAGGGAKAKGLGVLSPTPVALGCKFAGSAGGVNVDTGTLAVPVDAAMLKEGCVVVLSDVELSCVIAASFNICPADSSARRLFLVSFSKREACSISFASALDFTV